MHTWPAYTALWGPAAHKYARVPANEFEDVKSFALATWPKSLAVKIQSPFNQ